MSTDHLKRVQDKQDERQQGEQSRAEHNLRSTERRRKAQSDKVQRLYAGLETIEKRREVTLPMLSKGLGEPYTVTIRDIEARELFATNMFPPTAARLIEVLYQDSEDLTQAARDKVQMLDLLQDAAEDSFENPRQGLMLAIHEMEDVFACLAVQDPEIELVMHEWEAGGNKIWVRKLRREDITAIAEAVWHNVEVDASDANTFPAPGHTPDPVRSVENVGGSAEHPDEV